MLLRFHIAAYLILRTLLFTTIKYIGRHKQNISITEYVTVGSSLIACCMVNAFYKGINKATIMIKEYNG